MFGASCHSEPVELVTMLTCTVRYWCHLCLSLLNTLCGIHVCDLMSLIMYLKYESVPPCIQHDIMSVYVSVCVCVFCTLPTGVYNICYARFQLSVPSVVVHIILYHLWHLPAFLFVCLLVRYRYQYVPFSTLQIPVCPVQHHVCMSFSTRYICPVQHNVCMSFSTL